MKGASISIGPEEDGAADIIECSRAVVRFAGAAIGELGGRGLEKNEAWGLSLILNAVDEALDRANKKL